MASAPNEKLTPELALERVKTASLPSERADALQKLAVRGCHELRRLWRGRANGPVDVAAWGGGEGAATRCGGPVAAARAASDP